MTFRTGLTTGVNGTLCSKGWVLKAFGGSGEMAHQVEWRTALVDDMSLCPNPMLSCSQWSASGGQISFLALVMFMYPYRYNFK